MSKYNFDSIIERKDTNSVKWDLAAHIFSEQDVLPMWVADMDFQAPEEVLRELHKRVEHGVFGYTVPLASTNSVVTNWLKRRHNWEIHDSWVTYSPGIVFAISMAIQEFSKPGDKIVVQSPVYTPFFEMIEKNNRVVVTNPLNLKNNRYFLNFEDLETKLDSTVKLLLLCNPHNPGGRMWTEEELKKIGELCIRYNILVISDEIHADLMNGTQKHIPFASLSAEFADQSITCIAPSKTFNLAGLQASALIISNADIRKRFDNFQHRQGFFTLNTFAITGLEAAYRYGDEWLNSLQHYLQGNISYLTSFIEKNIPSINVMTPDASYLVWLDCRELGLTDEEITSALLKKGKLALEPGPKYGPGGEGFVRMNIGCPIGTLKEGLERLKVAFT